MIFLAIALLILTSCNYSAPTPKIKPIIKEASAVVKKPQFILKTIDLIPFEGTSAILVKNLYERLKLIFPKITLQNPVKFPASAYYEPRNRYKADSLLSFLSENALLRHISIGVTSKDISTSMQGMEDWGVMGLSYMHGNACVVSSFRLSKGNLSDQLFKVAIHELGHAQGLDHCENLSCFMRDAEGKNTTDQEKEFCVKCKAFLTSKGWMIEKTLK